MQENWIMQISKKIIVCKSTWLVQRINIYVELMLIATGNSRQYSNLFKIQFQYLKRTQDDKA